MFLMRLLPEETQRHLLAARKERLLAARSLLDRWIERVEARRSKLSEDGQEAPQHQAAEGEDRTR